MALRKTRWLIAALLCLVVWPGTTQGQSSALMDAFNRTNEWYAQGHYEEALPFAKQALKLGEHEFGPDHPTTAALLGNLATLYFSLGHYADSEPLHKRALAIRKKALGHDHPDVA